VVVVKSDDFGKEMTTECLNGVDNIGEREIEEGKKVAENRVYAHSIAKHQVGTLGKTDAIIATKFFPRSLFFFLLESHSRHQIQSS
jgi:hypothetical protein